MQALAFAIRLLRAIWGAIGGVVTLYGLYFLLVPLTLVGGIALLALAAILLALVLMKQRIRISMVVVAFLIAAASTLAAPFAIPGRIYVARCEQVSFDCVLAKQVRLGDASATVFPVADPIKWAVLTSLSATRPRFRMLPTTATPEGLYLVHAPLERVLSSLSIAQEDRGSLVAVDLPGMLSEFSISLIYNTDRGDIGGEINFAAGFSPSAYSFIVGRFASMPGFFGARSQHPPGFEQWREAVIGDLMLEALLRQDIVNLDAALSAPDPEESRRAALRRDLLHYQINPRALYGTVFSLQALMDSRALLSNHRDTIDSLTPDDPIQVLALQLISSPLFMTPAADASDMDKAFFRAQYDYYRALFSEEYSWAMRALPQSISGQRVGERLDQLETAIEDQRLRDFVAANSNVDESDPAAMAALLQGYARIKFADPDQTREQGELAALLRDGAYEEIDRRISAAPPETRAREVWRLMAVMEREMVLLLTDLLAAAQNGDAAAAEPPTAPIARWQEFIHSWSRHEAPLVREALDTRAEKLSSILQVWEAMRSAFAVSAQQENEASAAAQEAIGEEVSRMGEALQDRMFLPMLMEIAPSFEQGREEQIRVLQAAMLRRCEAEAPSPEQLSILGFLLLDTASRTPGTQLDRGVLDCMWSSFGREAPHHTHWTGVATTRGLMLIANDNRVLEINRALLTNVGGDPPWMLVMLRRLGRPQDALSEGLGSGAQDWERSVARYAAQAQ